MFNLKKLKYGICHDYEKKKYTNEYNNNTTNIDTEKMSEFFKNTNVTKQNYIE